MGSVPRAKAGVGSAVNDLSREMGGALGIAVLGSVMASLYRGDIVHRPRSLPPGTPSRPRARSWPRSTRPTAATRPPPTSSWPGQGGVLPRVRHGHAPRGGGDPPQLAHRLDVPVPRPHRRPSVGPRRSRRAATSRRPGPALDADRHAPGGSGVAPVGAVASLVGDGSMARHGRVLRSPSSSDVTRRRIAGVAAASPPPTMRSAPPLAQTFTVNLDAHWHGLVTNHLMTRGNPPPTRHRWRHSHGHEAGAHRHPRHRRRPGQGVLRAGRLQRRPRPSRSATTSASSR